MRTLSSVLALAIVITLFMGIVWAGCSSFLKNNSAYERGVATAIADPTLAEALGAPVEESWFINGSIEGDGMVSHGVWMVRLKGSRDAGTLRIAGIKSAGEWSVVALSFEADDVPYRYVPGQGFAKTPTGNARPRDILGG